MDFQQMVQVATSFTDYYYQTFPNNRAALAALYRPQSMLTYEGEQFQGEKIMEKLNSLNLGQFKHQIGTKDVQPSPQQGGILVFVSGVILIEGQEHPLKFSQIFQLLPDAGNYYIFNDLFRLSFM